MAGKKPVRPGRLSNDDLCLIAKALYGRDQIGYQSRMARDIGMAANRSISSSQINSWFSAEQVRTPPPWVSTAAYLALVDASQELLERSMACKQQADRILSGQLAAVPPSQILSKR